MRLFLIEKSGKDEGMRARVCVLTYNNARVCVCVCGVLGRRGKNWIGHGHVVRRSFSLSLSFSFSPLQPRILAKRKKELVPEDEEETKTKRAGEARGSVHLLNLPPLPRTAPAR